MKYLSFLLYISLFCGKLISQNIVRGPYLQMPTSSSIVIKWRTDIPSTSKVWYGLDPSTLTQEVSIPTSTSDHSVTINGLQPFTKYYYAVGNESVMYTVPSSEFSFNTSPLPGVTQPIRVWAIGDFGKGNTEQVQVKQSYITYTGSNHTDVWLWLGDNVYNDGTDAEYQQKVFNLNGFSDIFSRLPFWPTPGNHDYGIIWQQIGLFGLPYSNVPIENHTGPYYDMVTVPEQGEAGGYPSTLEVFYSFDYGNVHFLSLNSEIFDFTLTYQHINRMIDWIHQDLQQNDKDFTIAYFHQPPYSKGSHNSDDVQELVMRAMRERVIPVLEQYDVDIVLCGHSHVFERSFLIHGHYGTSDSFNPSTMLKNGTNGNMNQGNAYLKDGKSETPDGTVYVVCGNSGSKETDPVSNHPVMIFGDAGTTGIGSFIIDVYKNRLDGKYLKADGTIPDQFTILKKNLKSDELISILYCSNNPVVLQANHSGGSDLLNYSWSHSSETTSIVTVLPTHNSNYTLTIFDQLTGQSVQTVYQLYDASQFVPDIIHSNDTLFAPVGFNYSWYLNGSLIPNASDYFYVPVVSGLYQVKLESNACEVISSEFQFWLSADNQTAVISNYFKVYPNPSQGFIVIEKLNDDGKAWQLELINIHGQKIMDQILLDKYTPLDLSVLLSGIYQLRLKDLDGYQIFLKIMHID